MSSQSSSLSVRGHHPGSSRSRRDTTLPPSDIPRDSSPPSEDTQSLILALKRKIEALEDENERLKGNQNPKTKTTKCLGRPIRKVAALFSSINSLVQEYERRCDPDSHAEDDELNDVDTAQLNDVEYEEYEQRLELKRRDFESFRLMCEYVPYIKRKIYSRDVNHAELQADYTSLESGANAPLIDRHSRLGRRFRHDLTGRLLCPIDFDWDDLMIRVEIRAVGRRSVVKDSTVPFFLPFLYHDEAGDVQSPLKGWLQGPLLVKMVVLLFKSASSVGKEIADIEIINESSDDENVSPQPLPGPGASGRSGKRRKSTKKTVSQLWNVTSVSPRMIAYAATLLRFILSDGPAWGADDSFPYESFYNAIVDFFEDVEAGSEDELRNKKLLAWWTRIVYTSGDANGPSSTHPLKDFKNTIKNHRAAQHARRAAKASGAGAVNNSRSTMQSSA
ncbi:hypothetical protein F5890DRAFT_1558657 [Lentinula detonsa]|uniref:Uncharacterized protein n=1 Tax=Lentinula detonsa TaxID=2804962 RepID=A0AA38UM56_9AGAR|nr:hypothetical protein F5890DRAFT_1558657 [Lentinula detonsa]